MIFSITCTWHPAKGDGGRPVNTTCAPVALVGRISRDTTSQVFT